MPKKRWKVTRVRQMLVSLCYRSVVMVGALREGRLELTFQRELIELSVHKILKKMETHYL